FSSRTRHTRFSRDWSSDVCSSDLIRPPPRMLSIHRVLLSTAILILVLVAVALHSTATKITVVPVDSGAHPQLQNLAGYSFAIVKIGRASRTAGGATAWAAGPIERN